MAIKLSASQVNSWRLRKQHLDTRAPKNRLARVVSEICGLQAQVLSGAQMGIWARVDDITMEDVEDALWKDRRLVKTWCMRGTLHLLPADELAVYVAALKTRTGYRLDSWLKGHKIRLDQIERITQEARRSLDGRVLTREELVNDIAEKAGFGPVIKQRMLSGWGSLLHPAAYQGNLCFGPSKGKNVTFVRPDQWLVSWHEPSSEEALRTLLRRFTAVFGPCSHEDFGHWWGVPDSNARRIFESIVDELEPVEFAGRRAWLRKEDVQQIREIERLGSVRLLPSFDSYVMFYTPRELLVEQKFRPRVFRQLAGWVSPVLLIDGVSAGTWQYKRRSKGTHVIVEPFRALALSEQKQVKDEAAKLGAFFGTESTVSFATK